MLLPPFIVKEMDPLALSSQVASVIAGTTEKSQGPTFTPIDIISSLKQPLASVALTVYVPWQSPVAVFPFLFI